MADERKIYEIPDVELIDDSLDFGGIPFDVVVLFFVLAVTLSFYSSGLPLLRMCAFPISGVVSFVYYKFFSTKDKSFFKQIPYYLTIKRINGMPRPTDNEFME